MTDQRKVVIGRVSSPHGVRGWVKILSFTDPIENIFSYKSIFLEKGNEYLPFEIEDYSTNGKIVRIKLKGVDDRDQSEAVSNCEILIDREELPEISSDSYYWTDLLGFEVRTEVNECIGLLDSFFETGSNDVMVIVGENNSRKLIPFINIDVVKNVDIESKVIIVNWNEEE